MEAPPISPDPVPKKRGFPVWGWVLIVLVVCASPCVILAPFLLPADDKPLIAAQRTVLMGNMRQLGGAALMYTAFNDDRFPPAMDSAKSAQPYLAPFVEDLLVFDTTNPSGGAILGNASLGGVSRGDLLNVAETSMFFDEKPWQEKHIVVYADGHFSWLPKAKFDATDHQKADLSSALDEQP